MGSFECVSSQNNDFIKTRMALKYAFISEDFLQFFRHTKNMTIKKNILDFNLERHFLLFLIDVLSFSNFRKAKAYKNVELISMSVGVHPGQYFSPIFRRELFRAISKFSLKPPFPFPFPLTLVKEPPPNPLPPPVVPPLKAK